MALKGKIYSIARQHDDLNTNELFQSMIDKSAAQDTIVMDGRNLAAGSIFAEQIHAKAITAEKIDSKAIKADHIDAGSIDVGTLWGDQLILPGEKYGGVTINNNGLTMKSTGTAKLDIKLSSDSGFNITDRHGNQLIDIDPLTGNVKMEINQMTIGGYSGVTTKDIDDIEVGGRNYWVVAQSSEKYARTWASGALYSQQNAISSGLIPTEPNEQFNINYADHSSQTMYYNKSKEYIGSFGRLHMVTPDSRYSYTHLNGSGRPTDDTPAYVSYTFRGTFLEDNPDYKIMLQKGNKATDWTPAPEDVEDSYTSVAETKAGEAETRAKTHADGKAETAETNAKDYTKQQVDDIEVGGRNLLTHIDENWERGIYASASGVKTSGNSRLRLKKPIPVTSEQKYHISSFKDSFVVIHNFYDKNMNHIIGETWRVLPITVSSPVGASFMTISVRSNPEVRIASTDEFRIMVEKGTKGTDWTPAPEDVEDSYIAVAEAKANLAKTQAEAYADGEITKEEKRAIQDAENKLEAAKTYANTQAGTAETNAKDYAKKQVDDIEVGGRNLLRNAEEEISNANTKSFSFDGSVLRPYIGKSVIISLDAKWNQVNNNKSIDFYFRRSAIIYPTSGSVELTSEYKRYYHVWEITEEIANSTHVYVRSNHLVSGNNDSANIAVRRIKVELGNKASDWTPTPEDVEDAYTAVAEAKANLAEEEAKAHADGVVDDEEKRAIKDAQDKLEEAKKHAEKQVDDLEVGGRNLLRNSDFENGTDFWQHAEPNTRSIDKDGYSGNGLRIISATSTTVTPRYPYIGNFYSGDNLTLSVKVKTHSGDFSNMQGRFAGYVSIPFSYKKDLKDGWELYVFTTELQRDYSFSGTALGFMYGLGEFTIDEIKLEKGNKVTDWTPAPEDVSLDINKKTYNPVRYIRDWSNGSTKNTSNHWGEIQAIQYSTGENIAKGKPVTSNGTLSNPTRATDGAISSTYANSPAGHYYAQVDLGQVYYDIESLLVSHYYVDGRRYHETKTEVSADGTNWVPVFDSFVEGEYHETSDGRTYPNTIAKSESLISGKESMTRLGDDTSRVTISGGNIKAGTISSKNNFSKINLDDGSFDFGKGALSWDGSRLEIGGNNNLKREIDSGIIKGRNLIVRRNIADGLYVAGNGQVSTSGSGASVTDFIPIVPNEDYTLSGILAGTASNIYIGYFDSDFNSVNNTRYEYSHNNSVVSFKSHSSSSYIRFSSPGLYTMKLERGVEATPWSPAPEDIGDKLEESVALNNQKMVPGLPPYDKSGQFHGGGAGLFIEIDEDILLGKTMIHSRGSGTFRVDLREGHDLSGKLVSSKTYTLTSEKQWIDLDMLLRRSSNNQFSLWGYGEAFRSQSVYNWPLDAGSFRIKQTSASGDQFYYYFYNLHVGGIGVVGEEYSHNAIYDSKEKTDSWSFNGTTMIDGTSIETGTLTANKITTGVLEDLNKNTRFDLTNGTFNIGSKFKYDGSTLSVNADSINLSGKVTFSDFNPGLQSTVDSKVTQLEIDKSIDKIEIGGRNLILNTSFDDFAKLPSIYSDASTGVIEHSYNFLIYEMSNLGVTNLVFTFNKQLERNTEYVLSFSLYSPYDMFLHDISLREGTTNESMGNNSLSLPPQEIIGGKEYNEIEIIFQTDNFGRMPDGLLIGGNSPLTAGIVILNVKLEKGNKPTNWTPAPEDVDGKIDTVQSTADTALNRVTIKDTRKTNQSPSWYYQNYPSQIVTETKEPGAVGFSGTTMGTMTTVVPGPDSSRGSVKQTFRTGSESWRRSGTASWTSWANYDRDGRQAKAGLEEVEGKINNAVTTIDNTGVTVKDGSFFLEDDNTDTKYSLEIKKNLIKDHSFESVQHHQWANNWAFRLMNMDDMDNPHVGGGWYREYDPWITLGGSIENGERVGIFGKSIIVNNKDIIYSMIPASDGQFYAGMELTLSFHTKAPIHGLETNPRVVIELSNGESVRLKLKDVAFPMNSTKMSRHSTTFVLPSDYNENADMLKITLMSNDFTDVVYDGIQLVEGSHPVQYDLASETWDLRHELGMNSSNIRGNANYGGISPGLIHTHHITVPNDQDGRLISFMQSDGISTNMWVEEATVRRKLDVYGNVDIVGDIVGSLQTAKTTGKTYSTINATENHSNRWNSAANSSLKLRNSNNALSFIVGGTSNNRHSIIQGGHSEAAFAQHLSNLHLNKLGGTVYVGAGLSVSGTKNAIHVTRDGLRATPAYEMAESYLGDMGEDKTGLNNKVKIMIDTLFFDTINTDYTYHVFLQAHSNNNVWVEEREKEYFVIASDSPEVSFSWEMKAKRRGFEKDRLVRDDEITYEDIQTMQEYTGVPDEDEEVKA